MDKPKIYPETYQCLRNDHKTLNIELIFAKIQNFQCSIPLKDLGNVCNTRLKKEK